jgi:two-component system sensor histidine kinase PhoQ
MNSLTLRITLGAGFILALFIILTGIAIDRAYRSSLTESIEEKLQIQLYQLMAEAEISDQGDLLLTEDLPTPALNLPGSGLYSWVNNLSTNQSWQSKSVADLHFQPATTGSGFSLQQGPSGDFFIMQQTVEWEAEQSVHPLRFIVAEDHRGYAQEHAEFRNTLWLWLGLMSVLLMAILMLLLIWGLNPLRRAANDIAAVESGEKDRLDSHYPRELQGLTGNINALIAHERTQIKRYRDALGDLAHSLKTPLAILHGMASERKDDELLPPLERMNEIVQYQLQRASSAGRSALSPPVPLEPVIERLLNTLGKVYIDKGVQLHRSIPADLQIRGDQGDLMEMLGNVLDNAYKWTSSTIWISAHKENEKLFICIEDDGPGISNEQAQVILNRGVRLDEQTPGHGIGLAIVLDIVRAYNGQLTIEGYEKGARVTIILPLN